MTFSWNDMIIQREKYLNELIGWKHTDLIKAVTGIRCCGKSFLLFTLFHQHLSETGINKYHIVEIALDDINHEVLRAPFKVGSINQFASFQKDIALLLTYELKAKAFHTILGYDSLANERNFHIRQKRRRMRFVLCHRPST